MARFDFGGTLADFVVTSRRLGGLDVLGLSAATLTFWSAQSGGTRYTDLVLNGSAVTAITVGPDGQVPKFQGPDGVTEMWADGGSTRIRIVTLQGAPGPIGPASTVPGPPGPALPADQMAALSTTFARARAEIVPKPRAASAQVVLTFDDSAGNDWTIVKPILDAKGVKGTFCLLTGGMATTGLSWSQASQLAAAGHELAAHSRTHVNLSGASAATLANEVDGAFADILANTGIVAKGFCWPFGANDAAARTRVRTQGTYAIGAPVPAYNVQPFQTFALPRKQIQNTDNLTSYKSWVDHAVANNELLILLVHSGYDLDATQQGYLSQLIDYIKSLSVPIRTMSDALAVAGNTLDVGDITGGTSYTVVDGSGKLYASVLGGGFTVGALNSRSANDLPSTWPTGATVVAVNAPGSGGTPTGAAGTLITTVADNNQWAVQEFQPYAGNGRYRRARNGATDAWLAWLDTSPAAQAVTIGALNSKLASAAPSAFPVGVTINETNTADTTGTPSGTAGTLFTVKTQDAGWSFQEFHIFNSSSRWRRGQNSTGDAWLAWVDTSSSVAINAVDATAHANKTPSQFPSNVISYHQVNGPGSAGTPASAAGTLITTRLGNGWSFQEFQGFGGNSRWRRGQNGTSDAWLAWVAYA